MTWPSMVFAPDELVLGITGSQTWTHLPSIAHVLEMYTFSATAVGKTLVVVHGDCDRGADALAKLWVVRKQHLGWPVNHASFPADWTAVCRPECTPGHRRRNRKGVLYCPAAGNYRNTHMIGLPPQYVEGFHHHNSPGTRNCLHLAKAAGIPFERTTWENRDRQRTHLAGVSA